MIWVPVSPMEPTRVHQRPNCANLNLPFNRNKANQVSGSVQAVCSWWLCGEVLLSQRQPPLRPVTSPVQCSLAQSPNARHHHYLQWPTNSEICILLNYIYTTYMGHNDLDEYYAKNPAYGRQRISRLMRIVGPIQFCKSCVIYLNKKK